MTECKGKTDCEHVRDTLKLDQPFMVAAMAAGQGLTWYDHEGESIACCSCIKEGEKNRHKVGRGEECTELCTEHFLLFLRLWEILLKEKDMQKNGHAMKFMMI